MFGRKETKWEGQEKTKERKLEGEKILLVSDVVWYHREEKM